MGRRRFSAQATTSFSETTSRMIVHARVAMHGPIGDSGPMAFFDCPGGHRVPLRLACFVKHGPDFSGCYFPPKSSVSKSPTVTAGKWVPKDGQTLGQRRSSCLLFQIVGVETYLLPPHDQGDRGNLPSQGQAGHRGLPPLGE